MNNLLRVFSIRDESKIEWNNCEYCVADKIEKLCVLAFAEQRALLRKQFVCCSRRLALDIVQGTPYSLK